MTGVTVLSADGAARAAIPLQDLRPRAAGVRLAVVGGDRMFVSGIEAWSWRYLDGHFVGAASTVEELLSLAAVVDVAVADVSSLGMTAARERLRRLAATGVGVVAVVAPSTSFRNLVSEVGQAAFVTRDDDLATLFRSVREVALRRHPAAAHTPDASAAESGLPCPNLSDQERVVLTAYVSGLTLAAAARRAGVRVGTAKVYLDRVKSKYRRAGRPATTKLELARCAFEDGLLPRAAEPGR